MQTFDDEAQAVALANSTRYGLTGIVYTRDASRAERIGRAVRAGTIWVNCFLTVACSKNSAKRTGLPDVPGDGLVRGHRRRRGGCKHIIAIRLKQGGMRWTVAGANAIIALRYAVESNRFDDFWERRASAQS